MILIVVRYDAAQVNQFGDPAANSSAVLQVKMFKKIESQSGHPDHGYFFLGPLPNGLSTVFASVMPDQLLSVDICCSWLAFVEGTMYTFTLFLTSQFRQDDTGNLFGFKPSQQ